MNFENNVEIMGGSITEEIYHYKWYIINQIIFIVFMFIIFPKINFNQISIGLEPLIYGIMISFSIIIPIVLINIKLKDTASYHYIGGHHSKYITRKRKKRIWFIIIIITASYPISIWTMYAIT